MALGIDVQEWMSTLTGEFSLVVGTLREKGYKPYAKTLGLTAGLLGVSYFIIYSPSHDRLEEVQKQLTTAQATTAFAGPYKEIVSKMQDFKSLVPLATEKDGWLFNTLIDSAQRNNVSLANIGSQSESETSGYIVLSIPLTAKLTYSQLGNWLASLESNPKVLHISGFALRKDDLSGAALKDNLGRCSIELTVSTIIPKIRLSS